ncbi:SH3 domain-containing protein, partial [Haliangium sp.]|uniref:SH3 domain-containing protein n=1 Tax=Haliangium sp. TaxID=2663208 RepID=UPI003D131855
MDVAHRGSPPPERAVQAKPSTSVPDAPAAVGDDARARGGDESAGALDTALPEGGTAVNQVGKVAWDGDPPLGLRSSPTTAADNVIAGLVFDTTVQIIKRFEGGWAYVSDASGKTGYCADSYLWSAPEHPLPEPNARLHRVEGGEAGYAINIAREQFGFAADDWGQDLRFYVNVLG